MKIRGATENDRDAIWQILEPMIRAGETYALPRSMAKEDTLGYWMAPQHEVFVALLDGEVAGTYYLRPNNLGGGAHVANCGYVTGEAFSGRGVASAMCRHSLRRARERGFKAMQFNFVIASNTRAVRLWKALGFNVIGRLPKAFDHPRLGLVDALVMHRALEPDV